MTKLKPPAFNRYYRQHRTYPAMRAADEPPPQAPEDQRGTGYHNDASGWVRGARGEPTGNNEDATGKPNFDHSPPRSKMRR